MYFDFECTQSTGEHNPNYVIGQTVCEDCEDEELDPDSTCATCGDRCKACNSFDKKKKCFRKDPCDGCGKRQVCFEGPDTAKKFGEWLFHQSKNGFTAVAHNAKGYDAYFLLQYLVKNSIVPTIIYNGSKIMYMYVERGLDIRVIDSLNFLPMKLASLPKAFGLQELKKGFFPHLLNDQSSVSDYVGPYPHPDYYGVEFSRKRERSS